MNRLEEIKKRLNQRGYNSANLYDIGTVQASTDIACLLELVKNYESMLIEADRLLEGLSSGREIGTNYLTASEKAKSYSRQIQVEIREALAQGRKIKGES